MNTRRVDVCVVGGGAAGIAAACSAARAGAKVLLVERYGFLGGMGTGAMIGTFCGLYGTAPEPRGLPGAFGWTVVRALLERSAAYRFRFGATALVHFDPEMLKLVYDELVSRAGVSVLLHSLCVEAEARDGRVARVRIHTRGEPLWVEAGVFVDCSGDAELCHRAGAETELGDGQGRTQPATLVFRMGGVDVARALTLRRPDMNARMREDAASGAFALPRTNGSWYPTTHPGEAVVNMTRILSLNAVDPDDLTRGEQDGRRQVQEYARWLRSRVPGFERAYVSAVGTQIGVRETRRIVGRAQLTADDLRAGRTGPRDLALAAWPFERHVPDGDGTKLEWLPEGTAYGVPLGATVPRALHNVLVAGRCLSATHEAHASSRVMGTCFAVGEAAGAIAATRARDGLDAGEWTPGLLDGVLAWRRDSQEPPPDAWPISPLERPL